MNDEARMRHLLRTPKTAAQKTNTGNAWRIRAAWMAARRERLVGPGASLGGRGTRAVKVPSAAGALAVGSACQPVSKPGPWKRCSSSPFGQAKPSPAEPSSRSGSPGHGSGTAPSTTRCARVKQAGGVQARPGSAGSEVT